VAVGPDGALYVGELTGWPYNVGRARIWRVVPGHQPTLYASGFTNITDMTFDGRNLLVLEIAAEGMLNPASTGALIRVAPDGTRKLIVSAGLDQPTGVALANGRFYISNDGVYPDSGRGPHGELVSIPASSA
jgi:sugar lactone lactonase YvrE